MTNVAAVPIDPPSDRFRRRGPPDSGRGKARAPSLDDTLDDDPANRTPVEHLIDRVVGVEAVVVIAERWTLPDTEAWHRLEDAIADVAKRVKICEAERESRGRWAKILRGVLASLGAAAVSALAWAVVKIGDAGEERAESARRASDLRDVIQAVRDIQLQFAADHARLTDHLSTAPRTP